MPKSVQIPHKIHVSKKEVLALRLAVWAGPLMRQSAAACNMLLLLPFADCPWMCPFDFKAAVESVQVCLAEVSGRVDASEVLRTPASQSMRTGQTAVVDELPGPGFSANDDAFSMLFSGISDPIVLSKADSSQVQVPGAPRVASAASGAGASSGEEAPPILDALAEYSSARLKEAEKLAQVCSDADRGAQDAPVAVSNAVANVIDISSLSADRSKKSRGARPFQPPNSRSSPFFRSMRVLSCSGSMNAIRVKALACLGSEVRRALSDNNTSADVDLNLGRYYCPSASGLISMNRYGIAHRLFSCARFVVQQMHDEDAAGTGPLQWLQDSKLEVAARAALGSKVDADVEQVVDSSRASI